MSLTKWIKPNGTVLHLNDEEATVEHAKSMKWELFDDSETGLAEAKATIAKAEEKKQAKAKVKAA